MEGGVRKATNIDQVGGVLPETLQLSLLVSALAMHIPVKLDMWQIAFIHASPMSGHQRTEASLVVLKVL